MDHGSEVARPVESTDFGMAAAVQGGEANMSAITFHGQLGAAAPRRRRASFEAPAAAYHNSAEFARHVRAVSSGAVPVAVLHRELVPGVAYANLGDFWWQLGPVGVVHVVVVGPQLPDGVVPVHDNYGYSALQPRPGAGRGVELADLLVGVGSAVYAIGMQPRPGAGHGDVLMDLHPDGGGHGEVFIGPLPDGAGMVFINSGSFARQTLTAPRTRGADGIPGAFRGPNLRTVYNNRSVAAEHLRRLLPFAGIGACSVAVNGLAAGPGSPAVAFHLFLLLLGGLLLVILHVLRV